jgi:oligosaccharide repeat unit polymerase
MQQINTVVNTNRAIWTLGKPFLMLTYGTFVVVAFMMMLTHITGLTTSPYYSLATLACFFASTVFIYFIALENSAATFILSFTLTTAFSQRFIVTYFYPENLDYTGHLEFTKAELEYSLFFYTACVGAALVGFICGKFIPSIRISSRPVTANNDDNEFDYIRFFGFRLKSIKFLRIVVFFYLILVVLKILIISITGIGLTGATHTADQSLFHWLSSRSGVIGGYALFAVLLLKQYDKKTKIGRLFFFFYFLENLVMASRSFFLSIVQGLTVSFYVMKKRIKTKYIVFAIIGLIFSVTGYYMALTILRGYLLTGEIYISDESILLNISRGFSQLEPLYLWIDMPAKLYEGSVGFFSDIVLFINSFAIGDIIPDPGRLNLGKLMVQYGRQDDFDIFALAGHAENPGAFATTYMYLGFFGGMVYWLLLGFCLKILDKARIHLFWKFAFVNSFAFGPAYTLYTTGSALIAPMLLIGFAVMVYEAFRVIKITFLGNRRLVFKQKVDG